MIHYNTIFVKNLFIGLFGKMIPKKQRSTDFKESIPDFMEHGTHGVYSLIRYLISRYFKLYRYILHITGTDAESQYSYSRRFQADFSRCRVTADSGLAQEI